MNSSTVQTATTEPACRWLLCCDREPGGTITYLVHGAEASLKSGLGSGIALASLRAAAGLSQ